MENKDTNQTNKQNTASAQTAVAKEVATESPNREEAKQNTEAPQRAESAKTDSKTVVRRVSKPRGARGRRDDRKRRGGDRGGRPRSEFQNRVISIRRVTRVMAGGRRFSFSVAIVIGDGKGRVGVGTGKANDTILAIDKATRSAKKALVRVPTLPRTFSISHDVQAKYCASEVLIKPNPGKGVVAGSSVRDVLELAGVRDVSAKLLTRSKNKLNNAQAAIKALKQLGATAAPVTDTASAPRGGRRNDRNSRGRQLGNR